MLLVSLAAFGTTASAKKMPAGLTPQQLEKQDQSILDYIKVLRDGKTQPQPPSVVIFNEKYTELCLKRASAEYNQHGRWFYCEDKKEFRGNIRWDEVVTFRIYWQLYTRYGSLDKIPHYSKENHERAIKFWQSWQLKDGSFRNVFNKKGNGNDSHCNGKYVPGILRLLGSHPLHKTSGHGPEKLDVDQCLKQISERNMNHGTATVSEMLKRVHQGETELIPTLEHAVELSLSQLSQHTGMFQGLNGNPKGNTWRNYTTTDQTMKGMLRLVGYMGVENMPYRHLRADKLIENQEQIRSGPVSVKRNTAEMMVQCLLESPYRSNELLKALNGHAKVIMEDEPWTSHMTGDYTAYVLMMFGPYLNWQGYHERAPRTPFPAGAGYDYRVEVGPFGRCANVIKKCPEELLWHQDWNYSKYGLRARNTAHEQRKVIDIIPASDEGWIKSKDKEGRTVLTRTFTLEKAYLQNPYLKIKWNGDISLFINGVAVGKKLVGLSEYGAVHIPDDARKTLKSGANTLVVRTVGKANELSVNAGVIDWK